jgi:RNA polymerase sigma-70 factor, ECF subfamily
MPLLAKRMPDAGTVGEDFESLYEQYRRLVRSVVFKLALVDDVDDLVQETFLKVWRGRHSVREPGHLKAWVVRVAVNVARDASRSGRRAPPSVPFEEKLAGTTEIRPENEQLLLRGLAELSTSHREVLVLHCLEGLSLEEIATSLEIALGTVKSRLHYSKAALHDFLKRNGGLP